MSFEEHLAQIDLERSAVDELIAAGTLDAEAARHRQEDLQLGRALIEQGREDADLVLTALDLQRGAIEEGARPIPRLLRLLREIKSATDDEPAVPAPMPPFRTPEVAPTAFEEPPVDPRDFRLTESTEAPVTEEFRSEDYQFFRSRVDEAPMPMPPARTPAPPACPDSRRLRGPAARSRPSSLRPRPRAESLAPERRHSSGAWKWWALILLAVAGGGGTAAILFVNRGFGPAGSGSHGPGALEPAMQALHRAEQLRLSGSAEAAGAMREAIRAFDEAIRNVPNDAIAFEGRARAKWRLASWQGRGDAESAADADQALQLQPGRPVALALRGLSKFQIAVQRAGGVDPWPGQAVRATLCAAFPAMRQLVPGPEGMPASFGKIPAATAEVIRNDLRQALDSKVEAPWAALAEGVTAWMSGRGAEIGDPGTEELLWILKASASSDGLRLLGDGGAKLPDCPALHLARSWVSILEGRFDEAVESARRGASPDAPAGPDLLASAAAAVARSRAQTAMDDLMRIQGDSAMVRVLKAAAALQGSPPERALAEVESAWEELPIPLFRIQRAYLLLALRQCDRARNEFIDAALASPSNPSVRWLAALGLWTAGDFAAALAEADRAVAGGADPAVVGPAQELRALLLAVQGDEKGAAEAYRLAYRARPSDDLATRWFQFLQGDRQWASLRQVTGEFVRRNPKDVRSWRLLVLSCWEMGDAEETVRVVGEALRNEVDPALLLGTRALAREKLGRFSEALEDLGIVLTRRPEEVALQADRARILAKMARWEEAKVDADAVITRLTGQRGAERAIASAHLALAMVYAHQATLEEEQAGRLAQQDKTISSIKHAMRTGRLDPADVRPEGPFAVFKDSEEFRALADLVRQEAQTAKSRLKQQAFLGVVTSQQGDRLEVSGTIRGGAARAAGLQPGDILLEVESTPLRSIQDLETRLQGLGPGARVALKLERTLPTGLKLQLVRDVVLTDRSLVAED